MERKRTIIFPFAFSRPMGYDVEKAGRDPAAKEAR
jgi:hypothetical protein